MPASAIGTEPRGTRAETAPMGRPHIASTTGSLEGRARTRDLGSDDAAFDMIVDQPHRLHEGIDRRRTDERPALLFELLRQDDRLRGRRRRLRLCKFFRVGLVTPNEGRQRAFLFDELLSPSGVVDNRFDLTAMADDTVILEQTVDVSPGKVSDLVKIEMMEGGAEVLPLCEDRPPAQSGLKSLQAQFLEQAM